MYKMSAAQKPGKSYGRILQAKTIMAFPIAVSALGRITSNEAMMLPLEHSLNPPAVMISCFARAHHLPAAALVISTMMSLTSFLFSAGRTNGSRQVKGFPSALHSMLRPSLQALLLCQYHVLMNSSRAASE